MPIYNIAAAVRSCLSIRLNHTFQVIVASNNIGKCDYRKWLNFATEVSINASMHLSRWTSVNRRKKLCTSHHVIIRLRGGWFAECGSGNHSILSHPVTGFDTAKRVAIWAQTPCNKHPIRQFLCAQSVEHYSTNIDDDRSHPIPSQSNIRGYIKRMIWFSGNLSASLHNVNANLNWMKTVWVNEWIKVVCRGCERRKRNIIYECMHYEHAPPTFLPHPNRCFIKSKRSILKWSPICDNNQRAHTHKVFKPLFWLRRYSCCNQ